MQSAPPHDVRSLLREKGQAAFVDIALRYGKTFRLNGLVVTCEPEVVQSLLMEKPHTEVRSAVYKWFARIPGANGILFVDGAPWLKRVKAVMPAFHRDHVEVFSSSLYEATMQQARVWESNGRVADLFSAIQQIGVASVLRMGFGIDPANSFAVQLGNALVDYKQSSMNPDPRRRLDEFGMGKEKILQLPSIVTTMWTLRKKFARVRSAVKLLMANSRDQFDGTGWLARLAESGLSDEEVATEINHLYGAFNAIDFIVTAALYELARDPDLSARLRNELASAVPDGAIPTRESLSSLPLMRGFMLEILRVYPVALGVMRRTGPPMKIEGETIPAGTEIMILLYAMQHHPDFWESPREFRPERWAESVEPRIPFSYNPFLDGSRKCIGRSMAENQLLIILSAVIRNYDLRVFADAVLPPFLIPRFALPLPFSVHAAASA